MGVEEELIVALGNVLRERGHLNGDAEVMGDWHVMCEVSLLDSPGSTKYVNIIPGENGIPMHRVLGLIEVCSGLLAEGD